MSKAKILALLEENEYRYHTLPHSGLVNDWFCAYVELSRAILEHWGSNYQDSYELPDNYYNKDNTDNSE